MCLPRERPWELDAVSRTVPLADLGHVLPPGSAAAVATTPSWSCESWAVPDPDTEAAARPWRGQLPAPGAGPEGRVQVRVTSPVTPQAPRSLH